MVAAAEESHSLAWIQQTVCHLLRYDILSYAS